MNTDLILEIDAHVVDTPQQSAYLKRLIERHGEDTVRAAQRLASDVIERTYKEDFRESGLRDIQAGHISINQDKLVRNVAEALLTFGGETAEKTEAA